MIKTLLRLPLLNICAIAIFFWAFTPQQSRAAVKSFTKDADGVTLKLDKGLLKIRICASDIVEVKYTIFNSFEKRASLVVNNTWAAKTPFNVTEKGGKVIISTSRLKVWVDKATNAVSYTTPASMPITSESQTENKTITPATIAGISTYNVSSQFNSPKDEALYGLGCHPEDTLSINYKGRNQDMLIKYMTGAIPVLLSTKGYGLLWDNYSASNFYGAEDGNTKFKYTSESGKQVDYYLFYGPDFDHIIDCYRKATGKAPMFPKWAFGLFQSQDRYKYQSEVLAAKDGYRKNHIPVDVIVQDWYWWSPKPIGSHSISRERYPDPKGMVDELHKANIHAMLSIWPLFGSGTANYDVMKKNGFLTSITWDNFVSHTFDTYYDAHNPAARAMYWKLAKDSVIAPQGWDAWWVDQCEPDNGSLLDDRRKADFSIGKGIDYFNTYSLEHSKGIYQGWRKDVAGKRAFFLIRQSFAGEQRNAATLWSSDITTTFRSLKTQVPQGINACASGIPYWTSDIGGYLSRTSPDGIPDWSKPEYRELFTRWFQFGTFCPIMRIHGKGERAIYSKNWDESTRSILLKYDKLRYRMLPYVYSLAGWTTLNNYTMMRSLAFDFRNDAKVQGIPDQYMFGPAFMVSPVTSAQAKTRQVYLPAGTEWYDFWTGAKLQGGQDVESSAPIETIPLYVKAGSIIPMGPEVEYATQKANKNIELRIYPGADGKFTLYEDENDSYNYEKGKYATFTFSWNDKTHVLHVADTKGSFTGQLKDRKIKVVLVHDGHGAGSAEVGDVDKRLSYKGKAMDVRL